jgi:hypothetical protein
MDKNIHSQNTDEEKYNPNDAHGIKTPVETDADVTLGQPGSTQDLANKEHSNLQKPKRYVFLLATLLIVLGGVLLVSSAVFFSSTQKKTIQKPTVEQTNQQPAASGSAATQSTQGFSTVQVDAATAKTIFRYGKTDISVSYPSGWEAKDISMQEYQLPAVAIKSGKGNYLHLYTTGGIGGDCISNTYTYTMTHMLTTQSAGYVFTEYKTTNPEYLVRELRLESAAQKARFPEDTTKNVGDSAADTCSIELQYSSVGFQADNRIHVALSDSADLDMASRKPLVFDQIKDDPEFIKMLQSLTVQTASKPD